jgi:hypothetical protein
MNIGNFIHRLKPLNREPGTAHFRYQFRKPAQQAMLKRYNRSQVQGSTFRVKDKESIKTRSPRQKGSFSQIIADLAPNFGLGLTKLTLFS